MAGVLKRRAYSEQVRERVVHLVEVEGLSASAVAQMLGHRPCAKTVQKIVNSYRAAGHVLVPRGKKGSRHHNRKASVAALEMLRLLVEDDEQAELDELAASMTVCTGQHWDSSAVGRALREMGYVRKRLYTRAIEARADQQLQWELFIRQRGITGDMLVFVDEVATDNRVTNKGYAWVPRGGLSTAGATFVRGVRYSTVGAISSAGLVAFRTCVGAVDMELFMEFIEQDLAPQLQPFPARGSVLVMDNCAIHNKQRVIAACEAVGALALFLPPYSPMYNPIECLWNVYKQWLRHHRAWVCGVDPFVAISTAVRCVATPANCCAWIRSVELYDT